MTTTPRLAPNPPSEASSLFSLSNLEALAVTTARPNIAPPTADGSGMLDIRALVSTAQELRARQRPSSMEPAMLLARPVARRHPESLSPALQRVLALMWAVVIALSAATLWLALRR